MKANWFSSHGGVFRGSATGAKVWSDDGKDINTFLVSCVAKEIKMNEKPKAKANDYSHLEEKSEHFNFKNIKIGVDFDSDWENGLNVKLHKYKLFDKITMAQKQFYYLSKIVKPNKKTRTIYYTPVIWG